MRLPTIRTKGLMISVAVVALLSFAFSRLDVLALSAHTIWRGREQISWASPKWLFCPRLAFWVIPFLTIAILRPSRRRASFGSGSVRQVPS